MTETDEQALANRSAVAARAPLPHPDLDVRQLSPQLQEQVEKHVLALLDVRDRMRLDWTDAQVYLMALGNYGLACPHPQLVPLGVDADECGVCGSVIACDTSSASA